MLSTNHVIHCFGQFLVCTRGSQIRYFILPESYLQENYCGGCFCAASRSSHSEIHLCP